MFVLLGSQKVKSERVEPRSWLVGFFFGGVLVCLLEDLLSSLLWGLLYGFPCCCFLLFLSF